MNAYQLPILLYHRVVNDSCVTGKHKIYVSEKKFRMQMQWLKDNGYETITFRDLASPTAPMEWLLPPSGGGGTVILTFDDGYADNYTVLFPILKEFGFKAVIFLVTGCRRNDWGISGGEPPVDLMTMHQLREMDAYGIEFGGHTQHHVDLKKSSVEIQEKEINGCFNDLEKTFGKKPLSFSYPYGAYNEDTLKILQKSFFSFGITTIFGPVEWAQDRLRIRRIEVNPKTSMMSFKRKASGHYFNTNPVKYYLSNLLDK